MYSALVQEGPTSTWKPSTWADPATGAVSTTYTKGAGALDQELMTNEFSVRRARLTLTATLFKDLSAFVLFELTRTTPFLDYVVTWQPLPEIGLRAGQFKVPFCRQWLLIPWQRALISDTIALTPFTPGRDVGLAVQGSFANRLFEYQVGVYNGSGMANKQDNTDLLYAARVATNPLGPVPDLESDFEGSASPKLLVGLGAVYNPVEKTFYVKRADDHGFDQPAIHTKQLLVGGDLTFMWRGFTFVSEFFFRNYQPDDAFKASLKSHDKNQDGNIRAFGGYGQAGYFLLPKRLELVARGSLVRPNTEISDDDQVEATAGLNVFLHGYATVLQIEYGWLLDQAPEAEDLTSHQARAQLLFKF
jgi:hypothetical protein